MQLRRTTIDRRQRAPGIVLALGGGGARGLAHLGVLSVLEEAQIPIRGIAGTSAGSVIGAMWILLGSAAAVRDRWHAFLASGLLPDLPELRLTGERSTRDNLLQLVQTLKSKAVRKFALGQQALLTHEEYDRALAFLVGDATFDDLRLPFTAVACDFEHGMPLPIRRGNLRLALGASCAIPSVLPPYKVEDRYAVDGGVVAEIPVEQALAMARGPVVAVDISDAPGKEDLERITAPRAILRAGLLAQKAMRRWATTTAKLVIHPAVQDITILEFSRSEEAYEAGRVAAMKLLREIRKVAS